MGARSRERHSRKWRSANRQSEDWRTRNSTQRSEPNWNSDLVTTEMPKGRSQENPIHRPPIPTPDHSVTETKATSLLQRGRIRASSAVATLRRTVNVKTIARNRDVILTQNAGW